MNRRQFIRNSAVIFTGIVASPLPAFKALSTGPCDPWGTPLGIDALVDLQEALMTMICESTQVPRSIIMSKKVYHSIGAE